MITELRYPVLKYPVKIKSLNFDKDPDVTGVLTGIKGQYLMFEDNTVINMRKFGGYYDPNSGFWINLSSELISLSKDFPVGLIHFCTGQLDDPSCQN